jgi:uncharacterized protein (DUF4415 family)
MKKEYDFSKARRITAEEVEENRKAIEATIGKKRPRRPGPAPKPANEKHKPIAIRLHPKVLAWAKKEGARRGVGYQTVINETLLKNAS